MKKLHFFVLPNISRDSSFIIPCSLGICISFSLDTVNVANGMKSLLVPLAKSIDTVFFYNFALSAHNLVIFGQMWYI